jgi:hypothetical protein
MLATYLVLFLILMVTVWIIFNDNDEVHNLAATATGVTTILWMFIMATSLVKLLMVALLFFFYQRLYVLRK